MRIALALVVVFGCSKASEPVLTEFVDAKVKLASAQVQHMAVEAFPQWAATNPAKACPASVHDLVEYMNSDRDDVDPWGAPLRMGCGATLPAGAKGIAIWSLGPDGKDATSDDVRSWK